MAKKSNSSKKNSKPTAAKKNSPAGKSKTASQPIKKSALVAKTNLASQSANIKCDFIGGVGQITASLFRNGVMINMQIISDSGTIPFSDVQSGDAISLNGVCTGSAEVAIDVPTTPSPPPSFTKIILGVFLIN